MKLVLLRSYSTRYNINDYEREKDDHLVARHAFPVLKSCLKEVKAYSAN